MAESTTSRAPMPRQVRRQAQSVRAEERFLAAIAKMGATPLYDQWKGSAAPHRLRCINGHECAPWPSGVFRGQGLCKECVGLSPQVAWAAFQRLVTESGGDRPGRTLARRHRASQGELRGRAHHNAKTARCEGDWQLL